MMKKIKFSWKRFLILVGVMFTLAAMNYTIYQEKTKYDHIIKLNMSKFRDLAEDGNVTAQFALGNIYGLRAFEWKYFKDYHRKKSAYYHIQAANQGHIKAQYFAGLHYKNGYGVKKSEHESNNWFLKAANQGHLESQYMFALYQAKLKNHDQAKLWFKRAASEGHHRSKLVIETYN